MYAHLKCFIIIFCALSPANDKYKKLNANNKRRRNKRNSTARSKSTRLTNKINTNGNHLLQKYVNRIQVYLFFIAHVIQIYFINFVDTSICYGPIFKSIRGCYTFMTFIYIQILGAALVCDLCAGFWSSLSSTFRILMQNNKNDDMQLRYIT